MVEGRPSIAAMDLRILAEIGIRAGVRASGVLFPAATDFDVLLSVLDRLHGDRVIYIVSELPLFFRSRGRGREADR